MNGYLRQSTAAQVRTIGPFIDDTDFKTLENALTIANTDIILKKNGAASVAKNSGGATADGSAGLYHLTWDATDSNTVGELYGSVKVAGALVVFFSYVVLEEAVYDALYAAAAPGYLQPTVAARTLNVSAGGVADADAVAISADTVAADRLETMLDGTGGNTLSLGQLNVVNSAGSAIVASSTGGGGHGITASGNAAGEGLRVEGGATGFGLHARGGTTSGSAIRAISGLIGNGIEVLGGLTSGAAISAIAQGSGSGISATGVGANPGILATGGATGDGIRARGGATSGDGINTAAVGSGDGIEGVAVGAGNFGLKATLATDMINAVALAADAVAEIQAGLATAAALATVQTDTDDIQAKIGTPVVTLAADIAVIDDFVDTEVAAILAAVDTEVAAIKLKTDNLPEGIQKNAILNNFEFEMVDSADHVTPKTGLTVTAERSIDGGAYAACANAVVEVSVGTYKINLAATDTNGDFITLKFTGAGADATKISFKTES